MHNKRVLYVDYEPLIAAHMCDVHVEDEDRNLLFLMTRWRVLG